MLMTIALVVIAAIAGLLIYAATRPDSFRLERSTVIKAPPEKVHSLIDDFHNWPSWSPWEKKDLNMKRTYSGAPNGKGTVYDWEGNKNVGQGRMEITDSAPSKIVIKLDFFKPFEAHNTAEFTLAAQAGNENAGTNVTWAMYGPSPYISKLMTIFCSMDKMVGKDFEAGLANMKAAAEKA